MRTSPLTRMEKEAIKELLEKLRIMPPMAAQVVINIDGQGKVVVVELSKMAWK